MNSRLLSAIKELASLANDSAGNSNWYLFGSAKFDISNATDIDLLVICETSTAADAIRRLADLDCLGKPIHLSILTKAEQDEISFIERQNCLLIFEGLIPLKNGGPFGPPLLFSGYPPARGRRT